MCRDAGVQEIGLNFVPRSKRFVPPAMAAALARRAAAAGLRTVGVFQDQELDAVAEVLSAVRLDAVQLHGAESPEYCARVTVPVWKVFGVGPGFDPRLPARFPGLEARLFDTVAGGVSGGVGRAFDWSLLPTVIEHPWYLAGGLRPDNLAEAVALCRPDGVDLNSGVETAPGIKSAELLAQALEALRRPAGSDQGGAWGRDTQVDGEAWPTWILPSEHQRGSGEELALLLDRLSSRGRLVVDATARVEAPVELVSELVDVQMQARVRGLPLRWRLAEPVLETLLRGSLANLLDLVD